MEEDDDDVLEALSESEKGLSSKLATRLTIKFGCLCRKLYRKLYRKLEKKGSPAQRSGIFDKDPGFE